MLLVAEALACERNGRMLFSGLTFSLAAGQCAELRGRNGAGKSSLLRLVAGLVPKASGTLALNGAEDFTTELHYVAHQDALKAAQSVEETLQFWCAVLGGTSIEPALQAFRLHDLKQDPVQWLSAGQRRRLTLARLLLARRPLWLLDEPMTALDQASQATLQHLISDHLGTGGMVLAATHGDLGVKAHHTLTLGAP
jgi:heme exporter protein A